MRVPDSVRVTAKIRYRVSWVKRFDDPRQYGEIDFDSKVIFIKSGMSERKTLEAFTHELLHAIEHEYSIPIPHAVVHQLEAPIVRVLKLNKWVKS